MNVSVSLAILCLGAAPPVGAFRELPPAFNGGGFLAFSPDESFLAGVEMVDDDGEVSQRRRLSLWDPRKEERLVTLGVWPRKITCMAIHPDGTRIYCGDMKGQLSVWDVKRRRLIGLVNAHAKEVCAVVIAADGRRFATAGLEKVVRVWETRSFAEIVAIPEAFSWGPNGFAISPDGSTVVTGWPKSDVAVWSATTGRQRTTIPTRGLASALQFSADGAHLVIGTSGDYTGLDGKESITFADSWKARNAPGTVAFWDVRAERPIRSIRAGIGGVKALSYCPVGRRWWYGTLAPAPWAGGEVKPGEVVGLSAESAERTSLDLFAEGKPIPVGQMCFSPHGTYLAVASGDGRVWIARTTDLNAKTPGKPR